MDDKALSFAGCTIKGLLVALKQNLFVSSLLDRVAETWEMSQQTGLWPWV